MRPVTRPGTSCTRGTHPILCRERKVQCVHARYVTARMPIAEWPPRPGSPRPGPWEAWHRGRHQSRKNGAILVDPILGPGACMHACAGYVSVLLFDGHESRFQSWLHHSCSVQGWHEHRMSDDSGQYGSLELMTGLRRGGFWWILSLLWMVACLRWRGELFSG